MDSSSEGDGDELPSDWKLTAGALFFLGAASAPESDLQKNLMSRSVPSFVSFARTCLYP